MYVFFYAGMPVLNLPVIFAVYYTRPVFIVLLSSLILREHVTRGHAVAVLVAFTGALIVLRPGGEAFSMAGLIPLSVFWAILLVGTIPDATTVLGTVLIGVGGLCGLLRRRAP